MKHKVYKVLYRNPDTDILESACRHGLFPSELRLYYNEGEWIEPKDRFKRIFCFKSLEAARDFVAIFFDSMEIWECEADVEPTPARPLQIDYLCEVFHKRIKKINAFKAFDMFVYQSGFISDTSFTVPRLKLIKCI